MEDFLKMDWPSNTSGPREAQWAEARRQQRAGVAEAEQLDSALKAVGPGPGPGGEGGCASPSLASALPGCSGYVAAPGRFSVVCCGNGSGSRNGGRPGWTETAARAQTTTRRQKLKALAVLYPSGSRPPPGR